MHRIAFSIYGFNVYWYGLMMVTAYIICMLVIRRTRHYENIDMDTAIDSTIYAIIGGVIGSRLAYVLLNLNYYLKHPLVIVNVREGGLSWHGAMIGALISIYILSRVKKISYGKLIDFISVNSTIALAVGRWGCFLNGCCYGSECNVPWAVEFKDAGIAGLRHPTQLYESFMLIISFFILLYWWKRKKFDGEMTFALFGIYGIIRFIVEIFRFNTPEQYYSFSVPFSSGASLISMSLAQYFSIVIFIICAVVIIYKRKSSKGAERSAENGGGKSA